MNDVAHRVAPPHIAPGAVLAGRFRLESTLGAGGMAEVWKAFDLSAQRTVAVKLLRPQVASSQEAVQRLKREGEVLSALSHPAIVRIETYGQLDGGIVFLSMELLDGETLGARMRRGRMEPTELAPIVAGTCAGLVAAHAKAIVHRDLKPDNIFLLRTDPGADARVKVLDFGISKVYGGDRLTYTGEILGTPRYMSPEQLGAEPDVDPRVDIYALGVILYEALAGKPPFLAGSPTDLIVSILHGKIVPLRSLRPDLPMSLEAVVMRAMARAREARYRSAAELADAFLDAAGATARARALPKPRVMQTQALGGAGGASLLPELGMGGRASDADLLRPGTFSAFEAIDESAIRAAKQGLAAAPSAPAPFVQHAPIVPPVVSPSAFGVPSPAAPALALPRVASPPEPRAPEPRAASPMFLRIALVVAGLVAGAVSAAIAMAALHYFGGRPGGAQPPPTSAPAPSPAASSAGASSDAPLPAAPSSAEEPLAPSEPGDTSRSELAPEGAGLASDDIVSAMDPPPDLEPIAARPGRRRPEGARPEPVHAEGERVATDTRAAPTHTNEAHGGTAPIAPGADPLELAQRALQEGRAEECIAILDDAIARGGAPFAIRRRGDCAMRAGRRDEAIRDYQRFCRVVPDHPAVPALREQLAGMGMTCP